VINDLRNPFFAEFAVSFQMAMAARGYATVVSNADEDDGTAGTLVASMIEHGVDAVVISPAYGDPPPSSIRWRRLVSPPCRSCAGWTRGRSGFRSRVSTTRPAVPRRRGT
jgi:DNA-binding LacI/PurR family transcriptional regulator